MEKYPFERQSAQKVVPEQTFVRSVERKETDWEANFGLVVISGKPGAGTSSAARILTNMYGSELYKAGDTIREMTNTNERVTAFIKREKEIDFVVDEKIRRMVMNANEENPSIAEAQIGCLTALDTQRSVEQTGQFPKAPILRILIWAPKEERIKRLKKASDIKGESKTLEQLLLETTSREKDDISYWRELYPNLIGKDNPLEKEAKDAHGNPIYDIEIDNRNHISEEQTAWDIHLRLVRMGLVKPRTHKAA